MKTDGFSGTDREAICVAGKRDHGALVDGSWQAPHHDQARLIWQSPAPAANTHALACRWGLPLKPVPARGWHAANVSGPGRVRQGGYLRRPKKLARSGAGDLISTTTESSIASRPCSTPLGCRQTSPGPMMKAVLPTVDFTLPLTT